MRKLLFSGAVMLMFFGAQAQTGSTCSNPEVISALPYSLSSSTETTGNNYNDVCASAYSSQNDFVMKFEPLANTYVSIMLSNTGLYTGVFVTDGCPDAGSCVTSAEALLGNPTINMVYLMAGHTYYIMVSNDNPWGLVGAFTAFTIDIVELPAYDAGVSAISGIESGCGLASETLSATITNYGMDTLTSFDVAYTINGSLPVVEHLNVQILPSASYSHTFAQTLDLSAHGSYNIEAYTIVTNDGDASNDHMNYQVMSVPTIATFPYAQNFDGSESYWFPVGSNSTWALGTPTATIINAAATAPNAWVTNLSGSYTDYESSQLVSPCFDFSTLNNPLISFDIWVETPNLLTSAAFQYTTDGGANWVILEAGASTIEWNNPWYGSTGAWVHVSNAVPSLAGLSNLKFRINFSALANDGEGVAFDNFSIEECTQADAVADFTYTITGGTHVDFTSTSTNANSYSWDFGDFTSSTDQNPSHDYTILTGDMSVVLIVSNECSSDTITQVVTITVGQNEIKTNTLSLYPNPANDKVSIYSKQNAVLEVYSLNGQLIHTMSVNGHCVVDVQSWEKGIYTLKLKTADGIETQKLVIE